ncbi:type-F conjugative transfer system pilin assembly protein TraF [Enterobacter hormaechei]
MKALLIGLFILVVIPVAKGEDTAIRPPTIDTYVDRPIVGWHWYNDTRPEDDSETQEKIPLSRLSPTLQMALLKKLTQQRLYRAILSPSEQHAAEFLRLQSYLIHLSGQFTQTAKKALLGYPELDYNLEHSRYNSTATVQQNETLQRQRMAIHTLGQRYGLFLFYRGHNQIDSLMASSVKEFSTQYGLSLIPVSMDGSRSETLPQTRADSGQARRLGVSYLPAVMLVDPKKGSIQPLVYGFMTQDDLARRFLDVATDFQAQY